MVKKIVSSVIGVVVIVAIVVGVVVRRHHVKAQGSKPIPIQVQKVQTKNKPMIINAVGTLAAIKQISLRSEVNGYISKMDFESGQIVKQGDVVVELDNLKAREAMNSSRAAYDLSKVKYDRAIKLLKLNYMARQDVDLLKADLESKVAAMKEAEDTLAKQQIRAPFDGYLDEKTIHGGDYIKAGQDLVTLVDRSVLKVDYSVPEQDLAGLHLNQSVQIKTSVYPDKTFSGKVTYIAPYVDPETHSVSIQATIQNADNLLSPGLYVTIKQDLGQAREVVVVPEQAIVKTLDSTLVYRVEGNQVKATPIVTGALQDGVVEVLSGLKKGETIATTGRQDLKDHAVVKVVSGQN